jgi:hypothetical protein
MPVAGFLTHLFKQVLLVFCFKQRRVGVERHSVGRNVRGRLQRPIGNGRGAAGKDDRCSWHRRHELTSTPPLHPTQLDWRTMPAMDDYVWSLLRRPLTTCRLSWGSTIADTGYSNGYRPARLTIAQVAACVPPGLYSAVMAHREVYMWALLCKTTVGETFTRLSTVLLPLRTSVLTRWSSISSRLYCARHLI